MKQIAGGVCAATGFSASGVHCGIRKNKTKRDLALIYSNVPASAAAVYTTNLVKGAPLVVTKQHLADGKAQAIICNSGNANTCNANGIEIAEQMSELLGQALHIKPVRRCGRVYRRDRPAARHCAHRRRNPGTGQLSRPALRRGC